jgi:hypothetical protein
MLFKVAVGALLIVAVVGPLQACPVKKLAHVTREPLGGYTKLELAVRDVRTAEGGLWRIYFRHDGVPHSIVRIDFGETGQKQIRASFVGPHSFGMVVTTLRYDAPLDSHRQTRISERSSTEYLFCGKDDLIYVPVNPEDEASALESIRQAKSLRARLLNSEEIEPYLKRLR